MSLKKLARKCLGFGSLLLIALFLISPLRTEAVTLESIVTQAQYRCDEGYNRQCWIGAINLVNAKLRESNASPDPRSGTNSPYWIALQIAIPYPQCLSSEYAADIVCNGPFVVAVRDVSFLIVSLFGFGIVMAAVFASAMLVWAGFQYVASAGNPSKAEAALDKVKGSALSLVVLIFSTVILNQINPKLTNISLTDVETVTGKRICTEIKDQAKCTTTGNKEDGTLIACIWQDGKCDFASNLFCPVLNAEECAKQATAGNCIVVGDKCAEKRKDTDAPCPTIADPAGCNNGCVWQDSGCNPRDPASVTAADSTCPAMIKSQCQSNGLCEWQSAGACFNQQKILAIDCENVSTSDCGDYIKCALVDGACVNAPSVDAPCTKHEECGSTLFCYTSGQCKPRVGVGEVCDSMAYGGATGEDDDKVCQPGLQCDDVWLGFSGTGECEKAACGSSDYNCPTTSYCAKDETCQTKLDFGQPCKGTADVNDSNSCTTRFCNLQLSPPSCACPNIYVGQAGGTPLVWNPTTKRCECDPATKAANPSQCGS